MRPDRSSAATTRCVGLRIKYCGNLPSLCSAATGVSKVSLAQETALQVPAPGGGRGPWSQRKNVAPGPGGRMWRLVPGEFKLWADQCNFFVARPRTPV